MSTSYLETNADTTHHQSELSPQYEAARDQETASKQHSTFNVFPMGADNNQDVLSNDGGDLNGEKRKKKKKKNKKKKTAGAQETAEKEPNAITSLTVKAQGHAENLFDKTQSTVGNGEGGREPFSATKDDSKGERDFTPLKDKLGQSFFEDQDSSEDEGMPDYKIGGYHPIHVGEILLDRYVIIQKLGWGHFSTVWLTKDLKFNNYVAMKVQKSAQHYLEAAYDEVEILDQVASNWRTDEWKKSIDEFYKDDPQLKASLEKWGLSGTTSHCV